MSVLEATRRYENLTGSVCGTPYSGAFGKYTIKEQLNKEREIRNAKNGDSILNAPGKWVDNKLQDLVEKSLGVNDVKTMKETGINRYRQAGDLLTSLDNSAWTSFQSDKILNPVAAHSYKEQASRTVTGDSSKAFGRVNPDNSITNTITISI